MFMVGQRGGGRSWSVFVFLHALFYTAIAEASEHAVVQIRACPASHNQSDCHGDYVLWRDPTHGGLLRALGKDLLRLKRSSESATYWIPREPPAPGSGSMSKQF